MKRCLYFVSFQLHISFVFFQKIQGISSGKKLFRALEPWGNLLFNTNFAINFILYYIGCRNFRETLKQFLPFARFGRKRQPCVTVSHYHHSDRNYTVDLSTFNLGSAVERKSLHRDRTNETTGLMNFNMLDGRASICTNPQKNLEIQLTSNSEYLLLYTYVVEYVHLT